jgi:hypothetical protein
MSANLPISRVVLYKHGLGHFDRAATVEGAQTLALRFRAAEISDVLKSLVVLDLDGGHVAAVSYDSTEPPSRRLAEIGLHFDDESTLVDLIPQLRGAPVTVQTSHGQSASGFILGLDRKPLPGSDAANTPLHVISQSWKLSLVLHSGAIASFDLDSLASLQIDEPSLLRDLQTALAASLASHRQQSRTLTLEARGQGKRRLSLSYTIPTPVWKTSYRLLLGDDHEPHRIQGWAIVDNVSEDDWQDVQMSLVAGLPVSFTHDLDTPRYIERPRVKIPASTGVAVPAVALAGAELEPPGTPKLTDLDLESYDAETESAEMAALSMPPQAGTPTAKFASFGSRRGAHLAASTPSQAAPRALSTADFVIYDIQHPVTIHRNQSALVPILFQEFQGRALLLFNQNNHPEHPLRCVEFQNRTGLTLEAGPLTVFHHADYLGEAMLPTITSNDQRLIPFAVELKIAIEIEQQNRPEHLLSLIIKNRTLTTRKAFLIAANYTIRSTAESTQKLLLEHPNPGPGWELVNTPQPVLSTPEILRFELEIPPQAATQFPIEFQFIAEQSQEILPANLQSLGLARIGKRLNPSARKLIDQAFALAEQITDYAKKIKEIANQRKHIHEEQERLRKNLDSLGDRPSEKALRERYVKSLSDQENRLEQLEARAQTELNAQQLASAELESLLGSLQLEAAF